MTIFFIILFIILILLSLSPAFIALALLKVAKQTDEIFQRMYDNRENDSKD